MKWPIEQRGYTLKKKLCFILVQILEETYKHYSSQRKYITEDWDYSKEEERKYEFKLQTMK